jgi:hypothetical protein
MIKKRSSTNFTPRKGKYNVEKIVHPWTTEVRMNEQEAKEVCKLGQMSDCCAFLVVSGNKFECVRMNGSFIIFDRLKKGTINEKGPGGWKGCAWEREISAITSEVKEFKRENWWEN